MPTGTYEQEDTDTAGCQYCREPIIPTADDTWMHYLPSEDCTTPRPQWCESNDHDRLAEPGAMYCTLCLIHQ